jgi:hypothetical protein
MNGIVAAVDDEDVNARMHAGDRPSRHSARGAFPRAQVVEILGADTTETPLAIVDAHGLG